MSTNTPNYNLVKPTEATDLVDVDVLNANMDIIDTQLDISDDRLDVVEPKVSSLETAVGNLASGGVPHAIIKQGTGNTQTISDSTASAVNLSSVLEESVGTMGDTANDQILIPVAGLYIVWFTVAWAGNATGRRDVDCQFSGSILEDGDTAYLTRVLPPGAQVCMMNNSFIKRLALNATIKLNVTQTSGGNLGLSTAILGATWLRN